MTRRIGLVVVAVSSIVGALACKSRDAGDGPMPMASTIESNELSRVEWRKPRETPLREGDEAPNFVGLAHTGYQVRLDQFLDQPSVVYFFPETGTGASTSEAEGIRDSWLKLVDHVGMVLGVSTEDSVSLRAFASHRKLPFLLVSDVDEGIARSFGVPLEDGRPTRASFIIGTDGKVLGVVEVQRPEEHGSELVRAFEGRGQ
jgi:thioredoxin-dependent peroxiredoxin